MSTKPPQAGSRLARGFMLIELLIVLGMLAVVGLVAGQLFRVTLQAEGESAAQQLDEAQFDQALGQLRADVWRASSIEVCGPNALRLNLSNGQEIDWESGDTLARKSLSLAVDEPQQQWKDLGASLSFSPHGAAILVEVSRQNKPEGRVVLISQPMLLGSGRSR